MYSYKLIYVYVHTYVYTYIYIDKYLYYFLCIHMFFLKMYLHNIHIHTFIYIHLYIHIYIYLYAQLVISIHKVRQGKLQTASCWAHAPTSCSGDMFNAKSMPKSDQNLEKLDAVVAVGFRSIIIYIYIKMFN